MNENFAKDFNSLLKESFTIIRENMIEGSTKVNSILSNGDDPAERAAVHNTCNQFFILCL